MYLSLRRYDFQCKGESHTQQRPRSRDLSYATEIKVAFELFNTDKEWQTDAS